VGDAPAGPRLSRRPGRAEPPLRGGEPFRRQVARPPADGAGDRPPAGGGPHRGPAGRGRWRASA
jgi:hypothetical protein